MTIADCGGLLSADRRLETVIANPTGHHGGSEYDRCARRLDLTSKSEHQRMTVDDLC